MLGAIAPAAAQVHLEARYSATIAGIPIGSGTWAIDINDTQYTAAVSGATTGILRAFTGGQGNATARGTLGGGRLLSSIYAATITSRKKADSIRITIANGNVKDFKVDPPADEDPERVPITEASQRGVLDPMTASLVRMPGSGDLLVPEACQRTLEVFDGRLRYDMQFAFKRVERVKAGKGLCRPGGRLCSVFLAGRGIHSVALVDQIPVQTARYGSMARTHRRDPGAGAVPRTRADADRRGRT